MDQNLLHLLQDTKKILQLHKNIGVSIYPKTEAFKRSPVTASPAPRQNSIPPGKVKKQTASPSTTGQRTAIIKEIEADIADCTRCPLHGSRKHIVFGNGNKNARLLLIGNFPNKDEDECGRLYEGEAGKLLAKMLAAMNLPPADVYYTTLVKCRPHDKNSPQPSEINTCLPFLLRQIEAISPSVIWALGTETSQQLLKTSQSILQLRGRFHDFNSTPLMCTFHPEMMLQNEALKKPTWQDMQMIQKKLSAGRQKG